MPQQSTTFCHLYILHDDNIVDLLIISETKLDESFNDNLFSVDGYKVQRRDRNQYGGVLP
jgi:hypothetical protein